MMSFVVIVEPERANAERIRAILEAVEEKREFEYELLDSPEKAIELVENRTVDVFISDMHMPVMTGAELFSMIEMLSPETVRVAMTDADKISETVAFMNQCRTFKLILKPCRVADDLLSPIRASLDYKKMCERIRREEEEADIGVFSTEQDFLRMERAWEENARNFRRSWQVFLKVLSNNLNMAELDGAVAEKLTAWYEWMTGAYLDTMVGPVLGFDGWADKLTEEYNRPQDGCGFSMKKQFDAPIDFIKAQEIAYLVRLTAQACKMIIGEYKLSAVVQNVTKAYVLRVSCSAVVEDKSLLVQKEKVLNALMKSCEECISSLGNRSVALTKGSEVIVNIAVRK